MDNRVIEGRKMYHLDEKQIQEITDYIFLEDKLEKADAIFIPGCARPEHTEEFLGLKRSDRSNDMPA